MRTNSPRFSFLIRRSKIDKKGQCPVFLRIRWKGGAEVTTGIKVLASDWNQERQMCMRDRESNMKLREFLVVWDERVSFLERVHGSGNFSLDDIMSCSCGSSSGSGLVSGVVGSGLVDLFLSERHVSHGTCSCYRYAMNNVVSCFGENFDLCSMRVCDVERFRTHLMKNGISEGVSKDILEKVKSVYSWLELQGLCNHGGVHPFSSLKLSKMRKSHKDTTIEYETMLFIIDYLMGMMVTETSGTRWFYRSGVVEDLSDKNSNLFSLYFLVLIFLVQGMSPVDLCLLKKQDLKTVRLNGVDYYSISTFRKKTGKPVRFMRRRDDSVFTKMFMWMKMREGEMLLPVLEGVNLKDDKVSYYAMSNRLDAARRRLKKWIPVLNSAIKSHNAEAGDCLALIDPNVTYYSARHSFAKSYLQMEGANPLALASLMGRSPNTLATYISFLSQDVQIAEAGSLLKI